MAFCAATPDMRISAVILAGGKSSRMGREKAWIEYGGRPLILRQIETVRQLEPAEIFLSVRAPNDFASLGWQALVDNFPGQGPLAGIERALEVMQSPLLLVLAVDMPRVTAAMLRSLAGHCSARTGAVPRRGDRIEPLAAIYPQSAHRPLVESLGEKANGAARFADLCVTLGLAEFYDVPPSFHPDFANWNSPAELAAETRMPGGPLPPRRA
jgi:molybdopterin-guanine dinucleotide biosynthesis protein A